MSRPNAGSPRSQLRNNRSVHGFTLVEAMVSITLIALAGSALLLATQTSMDSSEYAFEQQLARGIANQMIDEILGCRYAEPGASPYQFPLTREASESTSPLQRILFDDTDDFNSYWSVPLVDPWAIELGQGDGAGRSRHANFQLRADYFDSWGVRVTVRYADPSDLALDLTGSTTSDYRSVEVAVAKIDANGTVRILTSVRRVYGYIPPIS